MKKRIKKKQYFEIDLFEKKQLSTSLLFERLVFRVLLKVVQRSLRRVKIIISRSRACKKSSYIIRKDQNERTNTNWRSLTHWNKIFYKFNDVQFSNRIMSGLNSFPVIIGINVMNKKRK